MINNFFLLLQGHHYQHAAINEILYRALASVCTPSRLEPGSLRWQTARQSNHDPMEEWQATSNLPRHSHPACSTVAMPPVERKSAKYSSLGPSHSFTPMAIETIGKKSLKELTQKVRQHTGKVKDCAYLLQRLSVAVQRGNAVSVVGSVGCRSGLDPFCVNVYVCVYVLSCVLIFVL